MAEAAPVADSDHYFAGNVPADTVDGAADSNRFLGPFLQAVYLLVAVNPEPHGALLRLAL